MLTPKEFAEHFDVTYRAVLIWIKAGKVEYEKHETLRGPAYLIPATELKRFKMPRAGRPRKKVGLPEKRKPKAAVGGAEDALKSLLDTLK